VGKHSEEDNDDDPVPSIAPDSSKNRATAKLLCKPVGEHHDRNGGEDRDPKEHVGAKRSLYFRGFWKEQSIGQISMVENGAQFRLQNGRRSLRDARVTAKNGCRAVHDGRFSA
jgi:hypothetical protein